MGKTIVEKILSKKVGRDVIPGETIVVDLDFVALHDASGPLAVRLMKSKGWDRVYNSKKVNDLKTKYLHSSLVFIEWGIGLVTLYIILFAFIKFISL